MQSKRQKAKAKKRRQYEEGVRFQADMIFERFGGDDLLYPALLRLVGMVTAESAPHIPGKTKFDDAMAYAFVEIERYAKQHAKRSKHLKKFVR